MTGGGGLRGPSPSSPRSVHDVNNAHANDANGAIGGKGIGGGGTDHESNKHESNNMITIGSSLRRGLKNDDDGSSKPNNAKAGDDDDLKKKDKDGDEESALADETPASAASADDEEEASASEDANRDIDIKAASADEDEETEVVAKDKDAHGDAKGKGGDSKKKQGDIGDNADDIDAEEEEVLEKSKGAQEGSTKEEQGTVDAADQEEGEGAAVTVEKSSKQGSSKKEDNAAKKSDDEDEDDDESADLISIKQRDEDDAFVPEEEESDATNSEDEKGAVEDEGKVEGAKKTLEQEQEESKSQASSSDEKPSSSGEKKTGEKLLLMEEPYSPGGAVAREEEDVNEAQGLLPDKWKYDAKDDSEITADGGGDELTAKEKASALQDSGSEDGSADATKVTPVEISIQSTNDDDDDDVKEEDKDSNNTNAKKNSANVDEDDQVKEEDKDLGEENEKEATAKESASDDDDDDDNVAEEVKGKDSNSAKKNTANVDEDDEVKEELPEEDEEEAAAKLDLQAELEEENSNSKLNEESIAATDDGSGSASEDGDDKNKVEVEVEGKDKGKVDAEEPMEDVGADKDKKKSSEWGDDDDDVDVDAGSVSVPKKADGDDKAAAAEEPKEGVSGGSKANDWSADDDDDDDDNVKVKEKGEDVTKNAPAGSADESFDGKAAGSVPVPAAAVASSFQSSQSKTPEAQIKSNVETELTQALTEGKLDEAKAEELEEEMEEALEEGMGEVFEEGLKSQLIGGGDGAGVKDEDDGVYNEEPEDAVIDGDGVKTAEEDDDDDEVQGSGKEGVESAGKKPVGIISLTKDESASAIHLADGLPAIGKVPGSADAASSGDDNGAKIEDDNADDDNVATKATDDDDTAEVKSDFESNATTIKSDPTEQSFDNIVCQDFPLRLTEQKDHKLNYLDCEEVAQSSDGCDYVLFSVDVASAGAAVISGADSASGGVIGSDHSTGTAHDASGAALTGASTGFGKDAGSGENVLRVEEEVGKKNPAATTKLVDEEEDERRRRLDEDGDESEDDDDAGDVVDPAGSDDDTADLEVSNTADVSIASSAVVADTAGLDDVTPASDKIVVTVGSKYCPVSCNVVAQCQRARDHFHPELKQEDGELKGDIPAQTGKTGEEGEVVEVSSGQEDLSSGKTEDVVEKTTSYGKTQEEVGEETVSTGMVAQDSSSCEEDDPDFLYKAKPGMDCAYIAANKPEKCFKLHEGQAVGAVSCPKSCSMVDACLQLKSGEDSSAGESDGIVSTEEGGDGLNATAYDITGAVTANLTGDQYFDVQVADSQDSVPGELVGNVTEVIQVSCEDDPGFLYKDKPGMDCAYIAANSPEKCFKLHSGQKVGVVSCPVSCSMVEECQEMYNVSGVVMANDDVKDGNSAEVLSTIGDATEVEEPDVANDGEEKDLSPQVDDVGESTNKYGEVKEDVSKDMNSVVFGTPDLNATVGDVDAVSVVVAEEDKGIATENVDANGWSADSSSDADNIGETSPPAANICKDDATFLYKEKEGYTCQVLGTMKAEKCEKLHLGEMIGVKSCPESCNMVAECLKNEGVASGEAPAGQVTKELGSTEQDALGGGVGAVDTMAAGTKSMADVIEGNDISSTFGGSVGEQQDSLNGIPDGNEGAFDNAYGANDNSNSYDGDYKERMDDVDNSDKVGFAADSQDDDANNEEGSNDLGIEYGNNDEEQESNDLGFAQEGADDDGVDKNDADDDDGDVGDEEGSQFGENQWKTWSNDNTDDANSEEMNTMEGSEVGDGAWGSTWKNNEDGVGDNSNPALDASAGNNMGLGGDYYGGGGDSLNNVPSGETNSFNDVPSANSLGNTVPSPSATSNTNANGNTNYEWEYDDDDGFPVSLFILFLGLFALFLYKKSRDNEQTSSRDCTRGGYQPVRGADHGKRW